MNTCLTTEDKAILARMRLERFASTLIDDRAYKFKVADETLHLEAVAPFWVDAAIRGFPILMDAAHNILGVKSIKLFYAKEWIADYYKENNVGNKIFSMVATLEREATEVNAQQSLAPAIESSGQNSDYISLDQLRAMAVEISGENEEFIGWMEQNNVTIPTKFVAGIPRYQTKAIFKAATDWNNAKIQTAMSRYLGIGMATSPMTAASDNRSNGGVASSQNSSGLKLLRTPSGFKAVKTGKDKYIKTVKGLIAAVPSERWAEYQQHILDQDEMGTAFVTRLSKQFDEKDAFAKLLEAFQEEAGMVESTAA